MKNIHTSMINSLHMYTTDLQSRMSTDAAMFSDERGFTGTPELNANQTVPIQTVPIKAFNDEGVSQGIVTAVEEQSITTNEIVQNVSQATTGIAEINESIASSSQMSTEVSLGVGQVKERSEDVKNSSKHVQTAADELSKLAENLSA